MQKPWTTMAAVVSVSTSRVPASALEGIAVSALDAVLARQDVAGTNARIDLVGAHHPGA
jgi:hypothetical protein